MKRVVSRTLDRPAVVVVASLAVLALVAGACNGGGGSDDPAKSSTEPAIDFDAEADADLEANYAEFTVDEPGVEVFMEDVAGSDAGFVAVGYETDPEISLPAVAAAWWSEDGWNWERIVDDTFDGPARVNALVAVDDGFVGVGSLGRTADNAAVWRSDDGHDWERVSGNDDAFAGGDMSGVAASGDEVVAVGRVSVGGEDEIDLAAGIWRSDDGETWERVEDSELPETAPDMALNGVAASDDGFVAGGVRQGEAEVWRSDDGTTWEQVESDAFADSVSVGSVAASDDGYVAVGSVGMLGEDSTEAIWFSPDGEEWEQLDVDLGPDLFLSGLDANDDGLFVVVGPELSRGFEEEDPDEDPRSISQVWASEDGRAWELVPAEDEEESRGSMFGVGVFANGYIAVGYEESSAQVWVDTLG